jgi:hypothetical protein
MPHFVYFSCSQEVTLECLEQENVEPNQEEGDTDGSSDDIESGGGEGGRTVMIHEEDVDGSSNDVDSLGGSGTLAIQGCDRSVPSFCAVCLDSYKKKDVVVWSSNSDCPHAFHRNCMVDYLVQKQKSADLLCPCCRQCFCKLCQSEKDLWKQLLVV